MLEDDLHERDGMLELATRRVGVDDGDGDDDDDDDAEAQSQRASKSSETSARGRARHDDSASLIDEDAGSVSEVDTSKMSTLALEYATGIGISSQWEDADDGGAEGCEGCCGSDDAGARCGRALSAAVCRRVGAKKLGYMAVLWSSDVYPVAEAGVGGARELTKLHCVVGPFWAFTACITYPLIFGISIAVCIFLLPEHHFITIILWALCLAGLLVALSCTSCRDPGILRRHHEKPHPSWRWNDQARTYRPPAATYDDDLGVIVTEFDHVCPWTGTAIGEKNLNAFHCFISLLCVCIVFDILLVINVLP
ncbi:hypothetical protein M885DRAFT_536158 [Pelagophyceae sp. CCMP2097]|nr:hypothetical protein M885DRAFT_536158 [Pelagophyceae sp. CCMP2097]|mmetsp:Transcript_31367/g.105642  ORF Transcript_31367/g.105642 Transcript_31367/m.105642 type:complete len:309 (+) Transcript_31367:179-1105(+)